MWRSMLKTAAATVAFALIHSAMADDAVRRRVRDRIGSRTYDGLYRAFQKRCGTTPGDYRDRFGRAPAGA